MTREEAMDLLETVVKGMNGKIGEAILTGLKDMKSMKELEDIKSEDCSGGACPIKYMEDDRK